jgi:hypothetical protein
MRTFPAELHENWVHLYTDYWQKQGEPVEEYILNTDGFRDLIERVERQRFLITVIDNGGDLFEFNDNNIHLPNEVFKAIYKDGQLVAGEG